MDWLSREVVVKAKPAQSQDGFIPPDGARTLPEEVPMIRNAARLLPAVAVLLSAVLASTQEIGYKLFTIPNSTFTEAIGVNDAGSVVGFYYEKSVAHGFLYSNGVVGNIDDPEAAKGTTTPKAINAAGTIVGIYRTSNNQERAFFWANGKFSNIKVPGSVVDSEANGINNSGQIVGMYTDGGRWHGYLFDSVTLSFQSIDVPNAYYTWGAGINDIGEITLFSQDSQNVQHAWLYNGTTFSNIDVPGFDGTVSEGINNGGAVTLIATKGLDNYGFVYRAGQFMPVDLPSAISTELRGINDQGVVVGNFSLLSVQGSFLAILPD